MNRLTHIATAISIAMLPLVGCAKLRHPVKEDRRFKPGDVQAAETLQEKIEFVAEYARTPVDFVVLTEDAHTFNGAGPRLTYAASALGARLYNTTLDARLVVARFDGTSPSGTFVIQGGGFVASDTKNVVATVEANLGKADGASSVFGAPALPAATFVGSSALGDLMRPEAFLAVMLVDTQDKDEAGLLALGAALDELKGEGNWSLSAIGLFDGDTAYPDCASLEIAAPFALKLDEMITGTGGVKATACQDSYAPTMSSWMIDASKTRTFTHPIKAGLDPTHLRVEAAGTYVASWTYDADSGALTLPQTIANGTAIVVTVETTATVPVAQPPVEPTTPPPATPLSPEEQKFVDEINPLLAKNCGACHGAQGGYTRYVGNFKLVRDRKAEVIDRIGRAEGVAGRMPPAGMDAGELAKLQEFLGTL